MVVTPQAMEMDGPAEPAIDFPSSPNTSHKKYFIIKLFERITMATSKITNGTNNKSYQYSDIQVDHGNDDGDDNIDAIFSKEQEPYYKKQSRVLLAVLGGAMLMILVLYHLPASSSSRIENTSTSILDKSDPAAWVLGMAKPRSCTFSECYNNNCNKEAAPFICLRHNGGPHMGCSPVAWTPETCDDDCDLSGCDSLEIPSDTPSCDGEPCTPEWCDGGQVCPSAASYQCVDGSARFGCSTDPLQWTLHTSSGVCSKCCDTTSCE